ncbi:MAG: manganese efflux pump MntP family protein [Sphaerochaetaceae bacterium]|nr:manganese efflux pump MntP family protein [Sphaerochaetaceae bacterium]
MSNSIQILLIAFSLAMDAFAVSIALGIKNGKRNMNLAFKSASVFAMFQVIMPLVGYYLGTHVKSYFANYASLISFILLLIVGFNMIREWRCTDDEAKRMFKKNYASFKNLIILGIATSIDALSVGLSLSFISLNIYTSAIVIGLVTLFLSFMGVLSGAKIGDKFDKSELVGGIVLIGLGFNILLVP